MDFVTLFLGACIYNCLVFLMGPDAMILVFWMLSFKPIFSLSSFTFLKKLFSSSLLFAIRMVSSESLGLQGDPTSPSWRRSVLGAHWKDWCWSWNSNTLATVCEELTQWKKPWCWEELGAGGEGDDRGWDGWMASPTRWTWVWVNSRSWWWTGRPGLLWFTGSQRVGHDWATELNWTELSLLDELIFSSTKISFSVFSNSCLKSQIFFFLIST